MAVSTSLSPIDPKRFGFAEAQHLLNRAGFGGTLAQIAALRDMGLNKAVDLLVDFDSIDASALPAHDADPDILRPVSREERAMYMQAEKMNDNDLRDKLRMEMLRRMNLDRQQMEDLERWWLGRMITTPRPLEEKLTLLWHGHFAANHRTVHDSYLMIKQNETFRRHAAGNFAKMATEMVCDPAMIKFLNNDQNRKAKPNENLARELMELFLLGEGNYTEGDIKEGARALTGFTFEDNDFEFRAQAHDFGSKTILGQTGKFKGEEFVGILLKSPACPTWVAYKLYRHFVGDVDEGLPGAAPEQRAVIVKLGDILLAGGYELRPALKTLFKSQHFYDQGIIARQIKSPAQLVVGAMRSLNAPRRDMTILSMAMNGMGQKLFEPPSVAGWYGGKGWMNTSTLFIRQNVLTYILTGKLPNDPNWTRQRVNFDALGLIDGLSDKSPKAIVERLTSSLVGPFVSDKRKAELTEFLSQRREVNADALIGVLLLATTMPEYQLC